MFEQNYLEEEQSTFINPAGTIVEIYLQLYFSLDNTNNSLLNNKNASSAREQDATFMIGHLLSSYNHNFSQLRGILCF